ncbi:MAG: hypothetical protein II453_04705 [Alphaproteobacteria bacterium]|nr:hypothetical protein [Alphaproteobacteria bacterium]
MSGGSKNYIYLSIDEYLVGQMQDAELDDLMKDVSKLAHDLEWAECGDYDMDDYFKTVEKFKNKWFKGDRDKRLKEYVDSRISAIKDELYRVLGVNGEQTNKPIPDTINASDLKGMAENAKNLITANTNGYFCRIGCWNCDNISDVASHNITKFCPICGVKLEMEEH